MSKYEGDLIKSLMWAVDKVMKTPESSVVPQPETDATPQIDRQMGTNSPVKQFSGWSDQKAVPTATERAEAWGRNNCDYAPPDEE